MRRLIFLASLAPAASLSVAAIQPLLPELDLLTFHPRVGLRGAVEVDDGTELPALETAAGRAVPSLERPRRLVTRGLAQQAEGCAGEGSPM